MAGKGANAALRTCVAAQTHPHLLFVFACLSLSTEMGAGIAQKW